jgi:hypothetical protein
MLHSLLDDSESSTLLRSPVPRYGCTAVPVRIPYISVVSRNPIRVLPYRYQDTRTATQYCQQPAADNELTVMMMNVQPRKTRSPSSCRRTMSLKTPKPALGMRVTSCQTPVPLISSWTLCRRRSRVAAGEIC